MLLKRTFDLLASVTGFILLLPVFVIISLLILIWMGWPVFFCHKRVGKGGTDFYLFKFRTMGHLKGASEGRFDAGSVSRVTPLGKILRKYKLDEIPQLINVINGDMSIVGPRPEVRKWTDIYRDKWEQVLSVRPGITDNASIRYRNEEELLSASGDPESTYRDVILPQKLDINIDYIKKHSFITDLAIIGATFKAIIKR